MAVVKQVEIIAKTGEAVKDVKKLNKEVDDTSKKGKAAGNGLKGAFKGFSDAVTGAIPMLGKLKTAMISTGVGALVVAFGSIVGLLSKAASLGADFSKELSGLAAVSGKTKDELLLLSNQAKQLGASTAYTAIQVVGLQTELAKLGFTIKDIKNATPAILDLASSLDTDLASAAMLAGSVIRGLGISTTETSRIVDVMARASSKTALDFEGLKESLKLVTPTARVLGISFEELTAMLGVLADSNIKGSRAGTQLNRVFRELNKANIPLEEAFKKVRTSSDQLGTSMGLVKEIGANALVTLALNSEKLDTVTEQLNKANGAARELAKVRLDNLSGDVTYLTSAWDGFLLSIEDGSGILNFFSRGAVNLLTGAIEGLTSAFDFGGFLIKDFFNNMKLLSLADIDIVIGSFGRLGAYIKIFANEAQLSISKIPIIGEKIDTERVKNNLIAAEKELFDSQQRIVEGNKKQDKALSNLTDVKYRYMAKKAEEAILRNQKQEADLLLSAGEELELIDQEAEEKEKARIEKARLTREKLLAKYLKKEQDLLANDATKKLELERERAYKEIELISETKEQENALKLAYDAGYLIKKADILFKLRGEALSAEDKYNAEQVKLNSEKNQKIKDDNQALADAEEELRDMKIRATRDSLVALSQLFKQGTAASKAAALADLAIGTGVGFIQALDIAQKGAKSMGPLAPLSFPVFYATQVAAVLGAAAKAKGILSAVKGGGNVPTPIPPPIDNPRSFSAEPQAPQFNVVGTSGTSQIADLMGSQPPIKAYVVSSDVTTSQSLDRNIIESATI